jgi:hypothetical protein
MYDPDAIKQAKMLADNLCGVLPYVEIIEIEKDLEEENAKDPGEFSQDESARIRLELFK